LELARSRGIRVDHVAPETPPTENTIARVSVDARGARRELVARVRSSFMGKVLMGGVFGNLFDMLALCGAKQRHACTAVLLSEVHSS
jgi:hypothetical protein